MRTFFSCLFGFSIGLIVLLGRPLYASDALPGEIADACLKTAHAAISDDFNDDVLDRERWAFRMKPDGTSAWGTDERYISIESEGGARYVAIRGNWKERRGSGLSSKHVAQFGFYVTRWRTSGISLDKMTPWHPAIWMAAENCADGEGRRRIPESELRLEIDFMEYWHQPLWQVQTVGWGKAGNLGVQKMRNPAPDFPTRKTGWMTQGLEYTPDYVQAWELKEGSWLRVGRAIPFVDGNTSENQLNRGHAQPGYWILSNKYHWDVVRQVYDNRPILGDFRFEDSSLDVDFFRYYPRVAEDESVVGVRTDVPRE